MTDRTISSDDISQRVGAATQTIDALRRQGHTSSAGALETLQRSGSCAWRDWLDLTNDAYDLLRPNGEQRIAEDLAFHLYRTLAEAGRVAA